MKEIKKNIVSCSFGGVYVMYVTSPIAVASLCSTHFTERNLKAIKFKKKSSEITFGYNPKPSLVLFI